MLGLAGHAVSTAIIELTVLERKWPKTIYKLMNVAEFIYFINKVTKLYL